METQSFKKRCSACGVKKPLAAFMGLDGKQHVICQQCLLKDSDGDSGGGGFQVDIVDKLAAIELEQERQDQAAEENFEAVEDRIEAQNERLDPNNKDQTYKTTLFGGNDKSNITSNTTEKQAKTTKTQTQTNTDAKSTQTTSKTDAKTSNQTQSSQINSLFAKSEQTQSNNASTNTTASQSNTTSQSSDSNVAHTANADKANSAIRGSLFGTNVPGESAIQSATGGEQATTQQSDNSTEALDKVATDFIQNLARGPGR